MVIQQNIDFYIMKSELHDSGRKSRRKEPRQSSRRKSRSRDRGRDREHSAGSFEQLRQENQFLKERLHFVLNELDFYKKQAGQQQASGEKPEPRGAAAKAGALDSLGAGMRRSKGHFDIPQLKKSLIDRYMQHKKTDTSKKRSAKPKTNNNTTADKILDNGSQLDVRHSLLGSQAQKPEQIADLLAKINRLKKPPGPAHLSELGTPPPPAAPGPKLRLFGSVGPPHAEEVLRGRSLLELEAAQDRPHQPPRRHRQAQPPREPVPQRQTASQSVP